MSVSFTSANAMSYEQARTQALFLTDKMAYELNLNEMQYEAVYEINLDYLLSVNTYDDVYARCWTIRNTDLRYILLDWQYSAFCAAHYFYRPIWWEGGYWHFGIYARYPHREYLYFGHPHFYATYRGGHSWHVNGGRSWYHGRDFGTRNHSNFSGMRDGWNRGDYRGGSPRNHNDAPRGGSLNDNRGTTRGNVQHGTVNSSSRSNGRSSSGNFSGRRESSTRSTITRQGNDTYGRGTTTRHPVPSANSSSSPSRSYSGNSSSSSRSSSSYSGNRTTTPTRSFSGSSSSSSRSSSSYSGSGSSSSSRSFSSGSSSSSRSGGTTRSFSSGSSSHSSSSHGSGSFGGRR